jgi:CRP-like cAMP-binding protein
VLWPVRGTGLSQERFLTSAVSHQALACASNQSIFLAGESGPVWRVVEGVVRLDRDSGPVRQPVQLALPGDLIGTEALCGQPYQLSASAFTPCRLEPVHPDADAAPQPLLQQALLQQLDRELG